MMWNGKKSITRTAVVEDVALAATSQKRRETVAVAVAVRMPFNFLEWCVQGMTDTNPQVVRREALKAAAAAAGGRCTPS